MMMILLLALITIILIITILLLRRNNTHEIPKIIWTYWDQDPIPEFIQKCIDTWRDKNPDYTLNIVTNGNLYTFVGSTEASEIKNWKYNNSPQRMSDLVRLSVLSKYGGIWLDASIICYESLDWVREDTKPKVYSIPELSTDTDPLIESWFIACAPEDPFVTTWNKEFRRAAEFDTIDDYVKDVNVSLKGIDFPDYLLVYVCAKKVYKDQPTSVTILDASDGPYNYHLKGGVTSLCNRKPVKLIKLRKEDRAVAMEDDGLKQCIFSSSNLNPA